MQNNDVNNKMQENESQSRRARGLEKTYFNYPLAFFLSTGVGILLLGTVWMLHSFAKVDAFSTLVFATLIYVILVAVIISALAIVGRTTKRHEIMLHRFDRMLDNMVFPYVITNSTGIIVKYNHAAKSIFEKNTFTIKRSKNMKSRFTNIRNNNCITVKFLGYNKVADVI